MIAVIFEVSPKQEGKAEYLEVAAELKTMLEQMDGFISAERFQSLSNPDRILSLSFWKNEESVKAWRELTCHRSAQDKGRHKLFESYRLRVAHVLRDYGMDNRDQVPQDSLTRGLEG